MSRPFLRPSLAGIAVGVLVSIVWSIARPGPAPDQRAPDSDNPRTADPAATQGSVGEPLDAGPPATEDEIRREVDRLLAFIAEVRGLELDDNDNDNEDAEVEVVLQGDRAFEATLAKFDDELPDFSALGSTLQALGAIEPGFDLTAAVADGLRRGVQGFFDPDADRVVIRGTTLSPVVRSHLAHELVHVLQRERVGDRATPDLEDGAASLAARALAEGDAEYVRGEFVLTLPLREQRAVEAASSAVLTPPEAGTALTVIDLVLGFPYRAGPDFVADLVEEDDGEFDLVDAAYRNPPVSTEQILHPAKYINDEEAIDPEPPEVEGEVIDEGTVGEFLLAYLLDPAMEDEDALEAATGWGGDAYVTARSDGRVVTTVRFVMDSEKDRNELVGALRRWARAHGSASVREESRAVILEASVRDTEGNAESGAGSGSGEEGSRERGE